MRGLSPKEANTIIEGAFEKADELKLKPLCVVVLDAGGHVKAVQKQDGASLLRFDIAHGKAFASLGMGRSSKLVFCRNTGTNRSLWRTSSTRRITRCFWKAVAN